MTTAHPTQATTYADAHRASHAEIHHLADGLPVEAFNWKPTPTSWSVAECVVHLNTVADAYLPALEAAVSDGARRGDGPFEYGFLASKLMSGAEPGGPALKTGANLDPSSGGTRSGFDPSRTLAAFDDRVRRYVATCELAEGLDLARIKVRYPFMRLLRLPLGALLHVTGRHALRHARQARRVTEHAAFPSSA